MKWGSWLKTERLSTLYHTGRNKRRLTLDYFASKLPFSGSDEVQACSRERLFKDLREGQKQENTAAQARCLLDLYSQNTRWGQPAALNNLKKLLRQEAGCCRYLPVTKENNRRLVNITKKMAGNKQGFPPCSHWDKEGKAVVRNMFRFIPSQSSYKWIILRRSNCSWEQTWLHHGDVCGTSWRLDLYIMQYLLTAGFYTTAASTFFKSLFHHHVAVWSLVLTAVWLQGGPRTLLTTAGRQTLLLPFARSSTCEMPVFVPHLPGVLSN